MPVSGHAESVSLPLGSRANEEVAKCGRTSPPVMSGSKKWCTGLPSPTSRRHWGDSVGARDCATLTVSGVRPDAVLQAA
jgi:hypothetical protein